MRKITATELARNTREVLESLATYGGEVIIERNHRQVAKLIGGPPQQTALEAMADLYRTIPPEAAETWEQDGVDVIGGEFLDGGVRDPWAS